jgi:penicillin V acylase-like amidase (Ntn superfamily)
MKTITTSLLSASLILSGIGTSSACTTMMMQDAKGNAYEARTMEWGGALPDALNYFPSGSQVQSETPDGKQGMTFKTKYGFVGVSFKHMSPNAKQPPFAEGANDQGLSLSLNAFFGASVPPVDSDDSKVLSALDFGVWALGNFQNVAQVKQALANKEVSIWLPPLALVGNIKAPFHFALWDKTGAGIVVEFSNGKVNVYDNPVGVMTNGPEFPWHLENLNNYAQLSNVDRNSGTFGSLKVNPPDGGNALAGLPSTQIASGRFVKAAFFTNYVRKAKTPAEAIQTLSHVINNFDRPYDLSIDPEGSNAEAANAVKGSAGAVGEVTLFTTMNDLAQNQFYIRPINSINFSKIDIPKLASVKEFKKISLDQIAQLNGADATELLLK